MKNKHSLVTATDQVMIGQEVAILRGWHDDHIYLGTIKKIGARIVLESGEQFHRVEYGTNSPRFRGYGKTEGYLAVLSDELRAAAEETLRRDAEALRKKRQTAQAKKIYDVIEQLAVACFRSADETCVGHAAVAHAVMTRRDLTDDQLARIQAIVKEGAAS